MATSENQLIENDRTAVRSERDEGIMLSGRGTYEVSKRILDILVSVVALLVLSPVMAIIALIIRLESRGPAIFSHVRAGKDGKDFQLYKFRSMHCDAEKKRGSLKSLNKMEGPIFKIEDDPRTTPFGRFLRKSSLDELPQLVNILTGEMSLVGPRPLVLQDIEAPLHPVQHSNRQEEHLHSLWTKRRVEVKPGLTGLWQVSGRNCLPLEGWIEFDLKYIESRSFLLDLKILLRTIPVVLRGKGAL